MLVTGNVIAGEAMGKQAVIETRTPIIYHPGHLAKLVIEVSLIEIAARHSGLRQGARFTGAQTANDVKESADARELLRTQSHGLLEPARQLSATRKECP